MYTPNKDMTIREILISNVGIHFNAGKITAVEVLKRIEQIRKHK